MASLLSPSTTSEANGGTHKTPQKKPARRSTSKQPTRKTTKPTPFTPKDPNTYTKDHRIDYEVSPHNTHYHIGSRYEFYSKSARKRIEGEVFRIIHDKEGSWLDVKYRYNGSSRAKLIPIPSPNTSYSSTKLQPIHTPYVHPVALDANPNDTPWTPSTSLDSSIRNQWSIGSAVEVYSVLSKQWMNGKVKRIIEDAEGEWLEIEYSNRGDMRMKEVQRDHSTHIRPTIIQRLEHTIPYHIHTRGKAQYSNTNNIIVTNTKHEYYVPNLEDHISRMEKEKKDWKATLYDVYMYDQIESKLNTRATTKITFKTPQRRSLFAKYKCV